MSGPEAAALETAILNGCDGCEACPFSINETAEMAQNLGCLPSLQDVLRMAREKGRPWGCHEDETKVCRGYASVAVQVGMPVRGQPISYSKWYREGEAHG